MDSLDQRLARDSAQADAAARKDAAHIRDAASMEMGAASAHPVRVFLVEDSPVIRQRLEEGITSLGQTRVLGHADTESGALASLADADCDVVVLDLDLKQGNGLRVLEWLRAGSPRSHPVVIIFTNYVLSHYRKRSLQLGADFFFDKARDFDRVLEVISGVSPASDHQ